MRGDGKKKANKKTTLKNPMVSRDVPLPPTLPENLKPYDTNNDGVLSEKERIDMNFMKRMEKRKKEMVFPKKKNKRSK